MPIRLSGLISGMDTESIVKELMKAQRLRTSKLEKNITKLEWTQDKWKDLNKKIYSFYTGSLSKLRFQGSYETKKALSSDETKVDVKASTLAPEGTHTIQVKDLASGQFITGSILSADKNGKAVTTNTKLTDLNFDAAEGTTIKVKTGTKEATLDVGSSTTVGDFINTLKKAGINASYDTVQKRIFISSKESGTNQAFSITTSSSEETRDRNAIRNSMDYGTLSSTDKSKVDNALAAYIAPESVASDITNARNTLLNTTHNQVRKTYIQDYIKDEANITAVTDSERMRLEAELPEGETLDEKVLTAAVNKKLLEDANAKATNLYNSWKDNSAAADNIFKTAETSLDSLLTAYKNNSGSTVTQSNNLSMFGLSEITTTKNPDGSVSVSVGAGVTKVEPKDAKVIYNGAELISSSNTITANGLTFTVKGKTTDDMPISLSVTNDTQAVYDMIKDFVKNYNELLTGMNEAYNAVNAKGFEPLTEDEMSSMTDAQIEKWESKIKDSLLRRDDTLSMLLSTMRSTLSGTVKVEGKSYSLSSFGIETGNYTEKGLLHINGDVDDSLYAGKENDLMKILNEDPSKLVEVFSNLTGELYSQMTEKMRSTTLRSALTVYNDKEITKEITNYKDDLKKLEDKLMDMENRYFKQFSAMESAMARMNSQSSALASMLGMNQQGQR